MSRAIRQATTIIALVLVLSSLAFDMHEQAYDSNWTKVDFAPYLAAANRLADNAPLYVLNSDRLYTTEQYVYPPLAALALRPFAGVGLYEACRIWTVMNVLLLLGVFGLYCWAVQLNPLKDLGLTILLCIIAFRNYPTQLEVSIGNVDLLILAAIVGIMAFTRIRRWKEAALLISFAACIKTWAIGFTVYFFVMRKWKEAILSLSAFVAAMMVMFTMLGLDQFATFLKIQKAYSYQPKLNSNSIIAMCKLFSGTTLMEHHHPQLLFPGAETILPVVGVIASLAVIAAFIAISWRSARSPWPGKTPLIMSFCIITGLLLNPICHQYYYIFALPVMWNLIVYADSTRRVGRVIEEDWIGISMWAGAIFAYLLLSVQSPGLIEPDQARNFLTNNPLGYGTTIIAGLILWLTTAFALAFPQPIKDQPVALHDLPLEPLLAYL